MLDRKDSRNGDDENTFSTELKNAIQEKYVNSVITFVLLCVSSYLATVAVFRRSIVHPLSENVLSSNFSMEDDVIDGSHTIISLLVLLLSSLALGWILTIIKLPPLFGALLTGIAFRNIPLLSETFSVDDRWEYCIRTLALCCIIIRWGIGLNAEAIRKRPLLPLLLGLVSPIAEVAAITVAAHFIFSFSLPLAILCGFLLAAVSPAVTVPVALEVQKQGRGIKKGVCTSILAASSIDNLLCIAAFTSAVSLIFSSDPPSITLLWTLLQIVTGIVSGGIIGTILWYFPLYSSPNVHILRSLLVSAATATAVLGGGAVGWSCGGIISAILFCFVGASRWKKDQEDGVSKEESAFASLWNMFFMPLLFALIGLKFDLDQIEGSTVLCGMCLIGLGAIARFVCALVISSFSLSTKESIFTALAFLPKATVQAALSPTLFVYTLSNPELSDELNTIMTSCIVTILITAPIGQLILQLVAPLLLKKDGSDSRQTPSYVFEGSYDLPNEGFTSSPINGKKDIVINQDDGNLSLRM